MLKKILVAASFAALVAAAPLSASAQTAVAPGAHPQQAHHPTRSYRSEMRNRRAQVHRRARAGAEHARQVRTQ